jgi:hypothetical protein
MSDDSIDSLAPPEVLTRARNIKLFLMCRQNRRRVLQSIIPSRVERCPVFSCGTEALSDSSPGAPLLREDPK